MSKQDHIGEVKSSIIDPLFDYLEHDLTKKSIETIVDDLRKANHTHVMKAKRRTFREMMEILKEIVHQIEMDERNYSLEDERKFFGGRIKISDVRCLHKATLAISELLRLNEQLKRQQRLLKRKLARQMKNNISWR